MEVEAQRIWTKGHTTIFLGSVEAARSLPWLQKEGGSYHLALAKRLYILAAASIGIRYVLCCAKELSDDHAAVNACNGIIRKCLPLVDCMKRSKKLWQKFSSACEFISVSTYSSI